MERQLFIKLTFIIIFSTFCAGAQSLTKVVNTFNCPPEWKMNLKIDSSYSSITFRNDKQDVEYWIFDCHNMEESVYFQKKTIDYYTISSCINFDSGNPSESFISFEKSGFYFVLKMCHNCNTQTNSACKNLQKELFTWILKK